MNVRRSAAVLAATAVIGAATPAVAASPSPTPSVAIPSGLYGSADPTYDGVWRQSLALLAQDTAGVKPAGKAVDWLTGQQCANGSFAAFRADPAKACDAKLMVDSNSTAAAVQALAALGGHEAAVDKAVGWLKSVQNADGGWGYAPGGASDTNSTSVVVGALAAAGAKPAEVVKGGRSPYDALVGLALPCAAGGAFAYQPDKQGKLSANADATAAGVLGALGKGLAAGAARKADAAACADAGYPGSPQAAANGAAYLAKSVAKDGYLTSVLPGAENQPDYGNTADAVVALAAQGGAEQARKPLAWLQRNAAAWAKQSGPAAYAQLVFAAHATGTDPRAFGGTDLVAALNSTGPTPQQTGKATGGLQRDDSDEKDGTEDSDDGFGVWWTVGVFLVAGIGIGFLISGRRKRQQ
ncbi:prenyltransferase/squalene oxidase repeat-containing protein [Streptomyces sp. ID05-39B]|uniref:prenyltransferase/squalene oxidase repeat-containing protein n=1 Tax=Streptomyces sp. ID05-39B TaxID=3028664 RepID=UPI0029B9768E|nr:prenyltransferase/squalene oxidase repeat-containing protein [Streptomyces sp. ID05-39B]MDX3530423.1 prenyltransferase/squalene oxidase repeat-containing protein [Streptomyces sp. ID05-39B]